MREYDLHIANEVLADLERIEVYVTHVLESPETAVLLYDRICTAITSLATLPERCRVIGQHPIRDVGLRQLLVDSYSVLYYIEGDSVGVLRVLYGASDLKKFLRD